jgi:DNA-binding MarR family transcriptional regulator
MPGPAVNATAVVMRLARELRTTMDQAFTELDLTSQQAGVLVHVFGGATSPKALARLLGTDTAGMTRMLDRLERKGLVRRSADPDDRRALVVDLTDEGRAVVPALPAVFERVGAELVDGLDPRQVLTTLERLLANLQQP